MLDKLELEAEIWRPVSAVLERYDALICPTMGTRGLVAGDDYVGHGLTFPSGRSAVNSADPSGKPNPSRPLRSRAQFAPAFACVGARQ